MPKNAMERQGKKWEQHSGRLTGGGVSKSWTTTPPREFCDRNTSKINLWAASHEEKWRRVTTKPKDKVQVHKERKRRGLHRPMFMD